MQKSSNYGCRAALRSFSNVWFEGPICKGGCKAADVRRGVPRCRGPAAAGLSAAPPLPHGTAEQTKGFQSLMLILHKIRIRLLFKIAQTSLLGLEGGLEKIGEKKFKKTPPLCLTIMLLGGELDERGLVGLESKYFFLRSFSFPLNEVCDLMYCLASRVLILPEGKQRLGTEGKWHR